MICPLPHQWAELAATYLLTREAHGQHETAKADLEKLVPEDAKEAIGHSIKAKHSKCGAVSFEPRRLRSSMLRASERIGPSLPPSPEPN